MIHSRDISEKLEENVRNAQYRIPTLYLWDAYTEKDQLA